MNKQLAAVAVLVAVPASLVLSTYPVSAGANCQPAHCYSYLDGVGTTFHGLYMTQRRASLTSPSTYQHPYFAGSSMWLLPYAYAVPWVEMGITDQYDGDLGYIQYETYWAYGTPSGFYYSGSIKYLTPDNTLDAYQIIQGSAVNTWQFQWAVSGQPWATYKISPDQGFWSGDELEMGGEIDSYNGHADTFNQNSLALNSNNIWSRWGTQGGVITDTSQLNGFSYSNSEWSWNTVS